MLRRWLPCEGYVLLVWLLCGISRSAALWSAGNLESNSPSLSLWDKSITLRTGIGYRDNVLWSSGAPEGSAFVVSGVEVIVLRTDSNGFDFHVFLSGDDLHYLSSVGVDKEQTLAVNSQISKAWASGLQTSLDLQYLYLNQMFDVSDTEADRSAVLAEGHALTLRPALRKTYENKLWAGIEFEITRQYFREPLDDYWELGPKLSVGRTYGHQSEAALNYRYAYSPYDTRWQTTREGVPLPGHPLAYHKQEVSLSWKHHWDPQRQWRTTSKLAYTMQHDNGAGYYNYDKYHLSQQIRYAGRLGEAVLQARLGYYDYAVQTRAAGDARRRNKTAVIVNCRGEKKLARWLKWYIDFEYEQSLANVSWDNYVVNTASSGFSVEF